jgi:hypothetical protein
VSKLRQDHPHLTCLVPEASLSANAPHSATLHAHALRSLLGVQAGDHASGCQQVEAAEPAGRVTSSERHDRAAGLVHRLRLVDDSARNASNADLRVPLLAYWAMGAAKGQHCSGVTDLRVSQRHVYALMRGGRARWKRANETGTTLKKQGDNFEPHAGHSAQTRSVVCATRRMLACCVDHTPQLCGAFCRAVWATLGSKRLVWERLRALCYGYHLASRREVWEDLWYGEERHRPLWLTDTS